MIHFLNLLVFTCISSYFVNNIKKTEYGNDGVMAITDTASEYLDDCIKLANRIRVKLADVLTQQRAGYYGFGDKKKEYFVFDQAPNIDKTITNNIEQERQCGDSDNKLKKKPSIQTISRGVILKSTTALRDANPNPSQFRKMGSVVKILEEIRSEWTSKQESLRKAGLSRKETQKVHVDQRKFAILERLKEVGGPFCCTEEIDTFLNNYKGDKRTITETNAG